jgi:hypothetical protein
MSVTFDMLASIFLVTFVKIGPAIHAGLSYVLVTFARFAQAV